MPRPAKRAVTRVVDRVDRKLRLSSEADRRLSVHAAGTGQRPSAVVEGLIREHLRRFVLTDRGEGPPLAAGEGRGEAGTAM